MANEMKMTITADSSSAMSVLSQFAQQVKGTTGEVEGHFGALSKSISGLMAPVMALGAALGGGALFGKAITETVDFAKETTKLSKIMGIGQKDAEALSVAIGDIYGDSDTFLAGAGKLVKAATNNAEGLRKMGIETRDAAGNMLPLQTIIQNTNTALLEYRQGADRDAAAFSVLGRSWQDWSKYLALTPGLLEDAKEKAERLHLTLDPDKVARYRKAVQDVDDAWKSVELNVGQEVMPTLSAVAEWMSSVAPSAIHGVMGLLQGLGNILGNTAVQLGLLAWGLNLVLIPALVKSGTAIVAWAQTVQVQMALASKAWRVGPAVSQLSALTQILAASIGPVLLLAAAVGVLYGVSSYVQSFSKEAAEAAEATQQLTKATSAATPQFEQQGQSLGKLEAQLATTSRGSAAYKDISGQISGTIQKMSETYPEFLGYLHREHGEYVGLAEAMEKFNAQKLKQLEMQLAQEKSDAARAGDDLSDATRGQYGNGPGLGSRALSATGGAWVLNMVEWLEVGRGLADNAEREQKAHLGTAKAIEAQIAAIKSGGADGKRHFGDSNGASKANVYQDEKNRLIQEEIGLRSKATLQEQEENADAQAGLKLIEEKAKIAKDLKAGTITSDQAQDLTSRAEANYTQSILDIDADYTAKRLDLERKMQEGIEASEEGGLKVRLRKINEFYVQFKKDNEAAAIDGKAKWTAEQIDAAKAAAVAQAEKDQIQADLEKLKKELSELAQISGGALSSEDRDATLARWDAKGGTGQAAAGKYRKENHVGEGAGAGITGGVNAFLAQSEDMFTKWKAFTGQILNGVQNSFSSFFGSILEHGKTGAQKWDALWKGISGTTVKALSDMAAQEVTHWGILKAKALWNAINKPKEAATEKAAAAAQKSDTAAQTEATAALTAATTAQSTALTAQLPAIAAQETALTTSIVAMDAATISAIALAAAEIWATLILPPLAIAGTAAMMIDLAAVDAAAAGLEVTGYAEGGLVTRPTLAMIGEGGEDELVAPRSNFQAAFRDLAGANLNMGYNIAQADLQARGFMTQASGYALQAGAASQGMGDKGQQGFHQALGRSEIVTSNERDKRTLKAFQGLVKQRGAVLRAGSVLPGGA